MQPLHLHAHYAHTGAGSLQKYKKKNMESLVLPPFWINIPTPPPPCVFFLFFKSLLRMKINILTLVFSGRAHAENK